MKTKLIIAVILAASTGYIVTATSPAMSEEEYYNKRLHEAVERNNERLRQQLDAEIAKPIRPQPQWFYTPSGQPQGYILEDRSGQSQMYDANGAWMGTTR